MSSPETPEPTLLAKAEITTVYEELPEQAPDVDYSIRKRLLSAFVILTTGRELDLRYWNNGALNYKKYSENTLSLPQQIDRLELAAGYPLRRHEWARELQGDTTGKNRWMPFLKRMHELQTADERDFELEQATVEVASIFVMGSDENGNRALTYTQVHSDEIYELARKNSNDTSPQRRDRVVGFPLEWGGFAYGEWIGFSGDEARKWYVVNGRDRGYGGYGRYAAPLDAITNLGSMWTKEDKKLIGLEYKDRPLAIA